MKAKRAKLIKKIKRLIARRAPFNATVPEALFIQAIADQLNSKP